MYIRKITGFFALILLINCICCGKSQNKYMFSSKKDFPDNIKIPKSNLNVHLDETKVEKKLIFDDKVLIGDEKETNQNKKNLNNRIDFSKSENKTFLREISGNGLKNKSYLFGTPHLIPLEYFRISNELKIIIKKVKSIAIESDNRPPKFNEYFDLNKHIKNKKEIEEYKNNIKKLNNDLYDSRYEKMQPLFILDTDILDVFQFVSKTVFFIEKRPIIRSIPNGSSILEQP